MARRKAKSQLPGGFDPKRFLARVGGGRTVARFLPGNRIFAQGDAGNAVFYIQEGRVKLTVVSRQGKEAVIALNFSGWFNSLLLGPRS
jgi:CRP/FNR family transcriptional regulator, cyclic AMP receptor protein